MGMVLVILILMMQLKVKASKIATVTAMNPPGRFGVFDIGDNGAVKKFDEKPKKEIHG